MSVDTIKWENGDLKIIDQTLLPEEYVVKKLDTVERVWEAIKKLRVRGAPAIGVAAAFGVVVGCRKYADEKIDVFKDKYEKISDYLASSRPTAVNLFWALSRMKSVLDKNLDCGVPEILEKLEHEAITIFQEDKDICRAIGKNGNEVISQSDTILTHCNAGGLATADYGTALGVIYAAHEAGKNIKVYADETRPLLQGARLTAWELMQSGVDVTLICDNMAGKVMSEGKINLVVVGADRIAKNGDAANKIGTYTVAVLAKEHNVPFYIAAPSSTFDLSINSGSDIPIEERDPEEVTCGFGKRTAPIGVKVYSPAFDVTPAKFIAGIITEKGILRPPFEKSIAEIIG